MKIKSFFTIIFASSILSPNFANSVLSPNFANLASIPDFLDSVSAPNRRHYSVSVPNCEYSFSIPNCAYSVATKKFKEKVPFYSEMHFTTSVTGLMSPIHTAVLQTKICNYNSTFHYLDEALKVNSDDVITDPLKNVQTEKSVEKYKKTILLASDKGSDFSLELGFVSNFKDDCFSAFFVDVCVEN